MTSCYCSVCWLSTVLKTQMLRWIRKRLTHWTWLTKYRGVGSNALHTPKEEDSDHCKLYWIWTNTTFIDHVLNVLNTIHLLPFLLLFNISMPTADQLPYIYIYIYSRWNQNLKFSATQARKWWITSSITGTNMRCSGLSIHRWTLIHPLKNSIQKTVLLRHTGANPFQETEGLEGVIGGTWTVGWWSCWEAIGARSEIPENPIEGGLTGTWWESEPGERIRSRVTWLCILCCPMGPRYLIDEIPSYWIKIRVFLESDNLISFSVAPSFAEW